MSKASERRRLIHAIRLTWGSLDSHLDYSEQDKFGLCACEHHESCGDREFHSQCVREYSEVLATLARYL